MSKFEEWWNEKTKFAYAKAIYGKKTVSHETWNESRRIALEEGFMAGQAACGIDPSYSEAKAYAIRKLKEEA